MNKHEINKIKPEVAKGHNILRVSDQASFTTFYDLFKKIFPADAKYYPQSIFEKRIKEAKITDRKIDLFALETDSKLIGMYSIRYNESVEPKIAFSPYGGMLPEYPNQSEYQKLLNHSEDFLRKKNVDIIITEFDNPKKIVGYSPQSNKEKESAKKRLEFFQANGYYLVDPNKLEYLCPMAGKSPSTIDSNLIMGIKFINNKDKYISEKDNKPTIAKNTLRTIYLNFMQLYNNKDTIKELKNYSSIKKFITNLNNYPDSSIPLIARTPKN